MKASNMLLSEGLLTAMLQLMRNEGQSMALTNKGQVLVYKRKNDGSLELADSSTHFRAVHMKTKLLLTYTTQI